MSYTLGGWLTLSADEVDVVPTARARLKSYYTVVPKFSATEEPPKPIHAYEEFEDGSIGIPIRSGMELFCSHLQNKLIDNTCKPFVFFAQQPNLRHPKASPDQPYCVQSVIENLEQKYATLLTAPTGSGKTVMGLAIAARLSTRTLIVVHKTELAKQWKEEIVQKLGIPESQIGTIQGSVCDVSKPIVIGMLQTLCKKKYQSIIKRAFGLVICDEVHRMGADKFSQMLGQVDARYWLGMTATPLRKDGKDLVYKMFFGDGDTIATAPALPVKVQVIPYRANSLNWGKNRNQKVLCVSRDNRRSDMIAALALRLYENERNVLIISDYTAHLATLYQKLMLLGVPTEVMGKFWGGGSGSSNKKLESQYFDHVKENSQIILATYGMMMEGVSINRLDAGIDATPRATATQTIGRIRRPFEGKKMPLWFTINDMNDSVLKKYTDARVKEYAADKSVELVRLDLA